MEAKNNGGEKKKQSSIDSMDHGTEDSRLKTYGMLNMICASLSRASPVSQYKANEAAVVVND